MDEFVFINRRYRKEKPKPAKVPPAPIVITGPQQAISYLQLAKHNPAFEEPCKEAALTYLENYVAQVEGTLCLDAAGKEQVRSFLQNMINKNKKGKTQ